MLSQITGALLIILETSSMDSTGISLETTLGPRNNDNYLLEDLHVSLQNTLQTYLEILQVQFQTTTIK